MNAFERFPHLHWTSQQLADAVPLRLHELFIADIAGSPAPRAANAGELPHRRDTRYVPPATLPARFHVR